MQTSEGNFGTTRDHNLSKEEWLSNQLTKDLVLWDRKDYLDEPAKQLQDADIYEYCDFKESDFVKLECFNLLKGRI